MLTIWGIEEVAIIDKTPDGWLTTVNTCFHSSLHRQALAGLQRQAFYWVHRWVLIRAESIYRARPESCVMIVPTPTRLTVGSHP